jgi:methylated-DNA-protein-cysteine methyltransferase-like protein
MTPFSEKTIEIIQSIPAGKVATYGQIALLAGNHRNARRVSRLIHTCSKKYNLPWHRIVNIQGKISLKDEKFEIQYQMLKAEGIEFGIGNAIDLKKFGF